ncbi:MAG: hypothetical protein AB7V50_07485 [Vampirovibrionia bacterium]
MIELIFAWFNIPFWTMLLFVVLLLGTTVALGGSDADTDADVGTEIDTDADISIETDIDGDISIETDTDIDIDSDIDADIDTDIDGDIEIESGIEADSDVNIAHVTGDQLTIIKTDKNKLIKTGKRKKNNLTRLLFVGSLRYLNAGKVPISMILSTLLTIWASIGLLANGIIVVTTGGSTIFNLPIIGYALFSGVALCSLGISFPITRKCSTAIGAVFDTKKYHSSNEDYIGSTAIVTSHVVPTFNEASEGKAIGILNLTDEFGIQQKLYAFIPDDCITKPKYKDTVIIIDYIEDKRLYKVVVEDSEDFFKWQNI